MKKYEWYDYCNLGKGIVKVRYEQYYYICGSYILCLLLPFTYIDMSGRGHRRLRLCSRKNYEKKYAVMMVSVSLYIPASTTRSNASGHSLVVSLPLAAFQNASQTNLEMLRSRLKKIREFSSPICFSQSLG